MLGGESHWKLLTEELLYYENDVQIAALIHADTWNKRERNGSASSGKKKQVELCYCA